MYKIKGRILAMLMVLVLCIGQFNVVIARDNGGQIQGTVTVAIEKFTLGEGYYIEPINVPFYENDKVGNVVARIIGSGKYNNGTDSENIGYLVNVYDEHLDMLNIPTYITNQLDQEGGILPQTDEWLGESDYTATSGWMYVVNNASANVGMGDYICADGDVIRLQFSLYGWGADIGMDNSAWGYPALIVSANKDALTKLIATINDRADKQTLLEKEVPDEGVTVETYYNAAMQELTNIEAEQEAIDEVYEKLQSVVAVLDEQDQQVAKPDEKDQSTHEKTKNERIEDILSAVSEEYKNYSYEWSIMDMAAYGLKDSLRQEDIDAYVKDAKELIQTSSKGTDFDKTAIIFTSLGIDPRTVTMEDGSSFDIIDYIATSERMDLINGAAFALLAYDSNNYPVVDKKWTREAVIQYIKDAQRPDGGWALMPFLGTDIDITAMVLSSLALYYNAEEDTYQVKECVEKAINCLSNVQKEDGLYAYGTAKNSNTVAMVIIALSALGIDADKTHALLKMV
ncbi:DUF4430 domain-containing protein [Cellulosilyticum ruminicola]|uniref:DUF4430 domain-containing protein n=1 Tax=Cellulosilyticum ruminicola TaxID=425254 RepID=UPI0006CFD991|nr:DUF4430 domain-containing protein [Cellulosilyticum ruminicola]